MRCQVKSNNLIQIKEGKDENPFFCSQRDRLSPLRSSVNPGPDKDRSAEQELIKLENEWAEAWAQGDVEFFERIEADDYTWTSPWGEVWTKAQDLAFVKSIKSEKGVIRSQVIAEMKVRVYGDAAVVTGRDIIKEMHECKEISLQERLTNTWVKRAGQWQCVAGHTSVITQK
jgi:ketosteroid isomerase-like protein